MSKLMYVQWIDSGISMANNIWQSVEDCVDVIENTQLTETVGIKVFENKNWLLLAQTVNDGQIRGAYAIYKKNIMRKLEMIPNKRSVK